MVKVATQRNVPKEQSESDLKDMVKYSLFCTGMATGLMEYLRNWGSLVQSLLCTGAQLAGTTKYVNDYKSYFGHVYLNMHITSW